MASVLATSLFEFLSLPAKMTYDLLGLETRMTRRQAIVIHGILRYAASTWTTFTSSVLKLWEAFRATEVIQIEAPPVGIVAPSLPGDRPAPASPIAGAAQAKSASPADSAADSSESDEDTTPPRAVSSRIQGRRTHADFLFPTE